MQEGGVNRHSLKRFNKQFVYISAGPYCFGPPYIRRCVRHTCYTPAQRVRMRERSCPTSINQFPAIKLTNDSKKFYWQDSQYDGRPAANKRRGYGICTRLARHPYACPIWRQEPG